MNPVQVQDYINMIKYVNLYINNTNLDEIASDVFNSELTDHYIDFIEKLQNNFMNTQGLMNTNHLQNLIKLSHNKYHK